MPNQTAGDLLDELAESVKVAKAHYTLGKREYAIVQLGEIAGTAHRLAGLVMEEDREEASDA